jgi:hypothetical protein
MERYDESELADMKRFITPIASGNTFRVYADEHSKFTDLIIEQSGKVVLT